MSEGMVSYSFTSGNKDQIDATLTNSKIPVYWKEYRSTAGSMSWNARGTDIDAANAIAAGYAAAKVEDAAIIDGVTRDRTNYEIPGLYQEGCRGWTITQLPTLELSERQQAVSGCLNLMDDAGVPVDRIKWNWAVPSAAYHKIRRHKKR